jgi:hypothetical protein
MARAVSSNFQSDLITLYSLPRQSVLSIGFFFLENTISLPLSYMINSFVLGARRLSIITYALLVVLRGVKSLRNSMSIDSEDGAFIPGCLLNKHIYESKETFERMPL